MLHISHLEERQVKRSLSIFLFSAPFVFRQLVNIPYANKMSHSKLFRWFKITWSVAKSPQLENNFQQF
ncbi:hypothetical protein TNCV_821881 [Trichonephila clavipes]|nr:hypothetical protein TNCV_821881 [Trichonephila clavipes]